MSHENQPSEPTAAAAGRQVGDILATVEAQLKQLRALQLSREKEGASLAEREEKVRLAETTLAAEWAKLERQRSESEKLRRSLEADRSRWRDHEQKLKSERENMTSRVSQLENDRKVLDEHRAGLEETSRSVEKLQVRVKELEAALEKAGEESDALTTETLEQLEAAHNERDEARRELEGTRGQLSEAREALAKSKRAADEQRGGNEKVKSLKAELQKRTQELDQRTQELQKQSQEFQQQKPELQKQSQELEQRTQELQKQSQELEQRTQELQKQSQDLQQQKQEFQKQSQDLDKQTQELQEQSQELQAARKELEAGKERIQTLEEQLASCPKDDGEAKAEVQRQIADLRGKAQRLAEVADHMKRRHFRLSKMRTLLKKQRGGATSKVNVHSERLKALTRNLEQRRRELVELRQHLALAERKMIRRWARPRSVGAVGWFLLLAVFSCVAGWVAADQYFPAVVTASVTLEAVTESGDPMHQDDELRWKTWHSTIVQESSFIDLLAKRMYEQQLDGLGTPDKVRMHIERDLRADDYEPETITYTVAGTDRRMLVAFLDVLGRTVVTESGKTFRGEPGRAWANIRDERVDGQTRYATLGDVPVKDERLRYAGPIAGVIFAVLLMFIGMAYTKLVRAKREFDDSGDMFGDLPQDDHLIRAA